ncbi:hypothetical protein [Cutibacterium avidum]|uniref:hypothetical protein n=1 Tax=Cutibacterium avidum TaxID=33010 RepID=UPI001C327D1E|nr:hypothetical protein [Cutibacterium avidum]BCQ03088.1 hypothetical protein TPCV4_15320 [Cutibacterium avidum]
MDISPSDRLLDVAHTVRTPALLYDLKELDRCIARLRAVFSPLSRWELSYAAKANLSDDVLRALWRSGIASIDVASVQELRTVEAAGFRRFRATGPSFRELDFPRLAASDILFNIGSLTQLEQWGRFAPGTSIGLRIRTPLSHANPYRSLYGSTSRFGVGLGDPALRQVLDRHGLKIKALHMHNGSVTPRDLVEKVDLALTWASSVPTVSEINVGGGLYGLLLDTNDTEHAIAHLKSKIELFDHDRETPVTLVAEPGAALVGPIGYFVTEVLDVEERELGKDHLRTITVDISPWNLAPWMRPIIVNLTLPDAQLAPGRVTGPTLYEEDAFVGPEGQILKVPHCRVGDRLLMAGAGAYTMTNLRSLHELPPPHQYAI